MESDFCDLPTEDDPADAPHCRYTLRQLAEISQTTPRRVRGWVRAGLIRPIDADGSSDAFGFHQVRTANLLSKLAQRGIGTARLGAILEKLGRRYSDAAAVLSQIDLCDKLLVIRDDESGLTAVDGQRLFDFLAESDPAAANALKLETTCDADDLFEQAVRLEQAGDLESAARTYRESLLKSGPDLMPCFNLANVLSALGRTEAAAERYRQAVEIDPEYGPAWNNLGLCLSELDEQPEAIEAWRRAIEIDPGSADAAFNLADALQEAGRGDEARPHWEAYLRLDADSEWAAFARWSLEPASV